MRESASLSLVKAGLERAQHCAALPGSSSPATDRSSYREQGLWLSVWVPAERREGWGWFSDYALFPRVTVAENIAFGLQVRDAQRVASLLKLTGLEDWNQRPAQLSGGQQQRVALARALAPRPSLLLLDEPFANVDAHRRSQLGQALREVAAGRRRERAVGHP